MTCKNQSCKKGIFEKRANSKDIVFFNSFFCSKECIDEYFVTNKNKVIDASHKQIRKDHREARKKIINYKAKLQSKVQEIARLIDYGLPCLARAIRGQMHGGHVFSKGSSSNMRFNLHNIHRQCAQSNHWQNDDSLFREGLKLEYGEDYFMFLVECRKTPITNYKNEDYMKFYEIACKLSLTLKKNVKDKPLSKIQRMELRNEINLALGIYPNDFCVYKPSSFLVSLSLHSTPS